VANVLRIVLLVQFAIPPKAVMHDVIGLLCLLLYVGVPACYIATFLVRRSASVRETTEFKSAKKTGLILWLLFGAMLVLAARVSNMDTYSAFEQTHQQPVAGYTSSVYAPGILKLENKYSLVYIKAIRGFYDTEHNPMICWKGSGYELQHVQTQTMAGSSVYTATLHRGHEQLYTAWWYGNGRHHTTSQWDWRWRMLKGETGYAVQNVTAADKKTLLEEINQLLSNGVLLPLLGQ
jgi:exosortase N